MSFKKFKSDVTTAAQKVAAGGVTGVLSVAAGDSDGEVVVKYHHDSLPGDIRIQALAQDLGAYPEANMFMLWTVDDDPPPPVVAAIEAARDYLLGMSVYEMIIALANRLEKELTGAVDDADEDDQDFDAACDTDYPSDGDEFGLASSPSRHLRPTPALRSDQKPLLKRIRRDLRQVKQAGYKVGLLDAFGQTSTTGLASISIRIDKLALSDEAMEAWDVQPSDYVVLLLRFPRPYDPLERVLDQAAAHTDVQFRVGKCNKYKPSLTQALGAFAESNRHLGAKDANSGPENTEHSEAAFEKLFISNSLDQYLGESFVSLLKLRETRALNWDAANELLQASMGLCAADQQFPSVPDGGKPSDKATETPRTPERHRILLGDHLREKGCDRSLPLIAMQFTMRHFVKCTEYCLRCHRRLEKKFEALRPYVCSNPLCLFQYMAMGFGPSIEHEIITEPYVVDLLVSFCYSAVQPYYSSYTASATGSQLPIRDLPVGLRLLVPDLSNTTDVLKARTQANNTLLVFENEDAQSFSERLAPTKWVAFRQPGQSMVSHARILEISTTTRSATIEMMGKSSAHGGMSFPAYGTAPYEAPSPDPVFIADSDCIVEVFPYVADFDSLDDAGKGTAMRHILDTLPPILEIEQWLSNHPQSSLRSMERISPAAASLLQWIVSSNRSCIFQVDRSRSVAQRSRLAVGQGFAANSSAKEPVSLTGPAGRGRNREKERILGMDGWVQFRFAQGSPDKELRFNRALQEVAARKPIQVHPTIFAWHGSSLANWHSILRTGLDFKDVRCGRAYGNGVYFSPHSHTSLGYTSQAGQPWPNSDLMISTCMSLNEIINAPDEFVSRNPHYVVSQLDWHQCRYLFVQTYSGRSLQSPGLVPDNKANTPLSDMVGGQGFYPQAPGFEVYGQGHEPLRIPLAAIPLRTIGAIAPTQRSPTKRAISLPAESDNEDDPDFAILFTDDEFTPIPSPPNKKSVSRSSSVDPGIVLKRYYPFRNPFLQRKT